MASIAKSVAFVKQTTHGGPPRSEFFPEAATQTFKKGEPVYLAAGYLTECGDNPVSILGIAQEDAHNDATAGTHKVSVELAEPESLICMNVASSALFGARTLKTAHVGCMAVLFRDTTNSKLYCDPDTSGSNARVVVDKLVDQADDINGRVLVRVRSAYYQLNSSS